MAILNIGLPNKITEYPNSFERQNAFPLERYSVFYSTTDAEDYASNSPLAYVGQNIVICESDDVNLYIIQNTAGDLKKVGNDNELKYEYIDGTLKLF